MAPQPQPVPTPIASPLPGPIPQPVLPIDSHHQAMNEAFRIYMRDNNIAPGAQIMPPTRLPNTTLGDLIKLDTNVYKIDIKAKTMIYCYDVEISAMLANEKKLVFTKQGHADFVVLDRHRKCIEIYKQMIKDESDFFKLSEGNLLVYDGQKLLYSFKNLFTDEVLPTIAQSRSLVINTSQIEILGSLEQVTVTIATSVRSVIEFTRENLLNSNINFDLTRLDRSLAQFLELVLNQNCVLDPTRFGIFENGKVFILQPKEERNYRKEDSMGMNDKQVLPGIKKSVAFVEGSKGRDSQTPSVVVDAMKSVFHKEMTVYEKCLSIVNGYQRSLKPADSMKCDKIMKGLDCYSTYTSRRRHLIIKGIHTTSAADQMFMLPDNNRISVKNYFFRKYNIELRHPDFNLVVCKEGSKTNYYPMELLTINEHQRVSTNQRSVSEARNSTKACTLVPDERKRLINAGIDTFNWNENNLLFAALKIRVEAVPLSLDGRLWKSPLIKYNSKQEKPENGKWKSKYSSFICPAKVPKIWAVYVVTKTGSRFTKKHLDDFAKMFVAETKNRGFEFPKPAESNLLEYRYIKEEIVFAAKSNCEYLLCITEDTITDLHALYKMMERDHEMIIQDCRLTTVEKILQKKSLALENIVAKLNVKLGGINYAVQSNLLGNKDKFELHEDQLIVGIGISGMTTDMSKMPKGTQALNPISVGYTSNAKHQDMFVGDFILTPNAPGTITCVQQIMGTVLEDFRKYRKRDPKRIIVYRSGASDTVYSSILENEVPLIRHAINKYDDKTKFIYIVVSKDHSQRFFKSETTGSSSSGYGSMRNQGNINGSAAEANIPPGVVVDTIVTNPARKMFFLNSHTTIQGSAKTPSYTVLFDELNSPLKPIEATTYSLCHHHQIVALTTSLPSPLYIANEYAKRGRTLWIEKMKTIDSSVPDLTKLAECNEKCRYRTTRFVDKRVNA